MSYGVTNVRQDSWSCSGQGCKERMIAIAIGAALTAIAGVATYFCIVHGLSLYDTAFTSLEKFGAGSLLYSGVVFSVVAVGNALYTGGKIVCHNESEEFKYTPSEAKIQIALSIFAPVAALPAVIILGLCAAMKR